MLFYRFDWNKVFLTEVKIGGNLRNYWFLGITHYKFQATKKLVLDILEINEEGLFPPDRSGFKLVKKFKGNRSFWSLLGNAYQVALTDFLIAYYGKRDLRTIFETKAVHLAEKLSKLYEPYREIRFKVLLERFNLPSFKRKKFYELWKGYRDLVFNQLKEVVKSFNQEEAFFKLFQLAILDFASRRLFVLNVGSLKRGGKDFFLKPLELKEIFNFAQNLIENTPKELFSLKEVEEIPPPQMEILNSPPGTNKRTIYTTDLVIETKDEVLINELKIFQSERGLNTKIQKGLIQVLLFALPFLTTQKRVKVNLITPNTLPNIWTLNLQEIFKGQRVEEIIGKYRLLLEALYQNRKFAKNLDKGSQG